MISEKQAYEIAKGHSDLVAYMYHIGKEYVFGIFPNDQELSCGLVMNDDGKNVKKIPMYTLFDYDDMVEQGKGKEIDIKQFEKTVS